MRNALQNTNVPFHEIVCIIPPSYSLNWFEKSWPNVPLNHDDGSFCLQCMNGIQGTNPAVLYWNKFLDAVITIIKYKKNTIYHDISFMVLYYGKVSYL